MYRLIYFVHHSRIENIDSVLNSSLKGATPVTICDRTFPDFVAQEIKFDSIEKVNTFIYRAYMAFGVYFLVEELTKN